MKTNTKIAALLALPAILLAPLMAQETPTDAPQGPKGRKMNPEMRAKMLEKFDADKDGKLSEEERAAMRAARPARKGAKGPQGEGAQGQGPKGKKMSPEMRAKMLEKFDTDKDGKLSKEEREAMKAARAAKKAQAAE